MKINLSLLSAVLIISFTLVQFDCRAQREKTDVYVGKTESDFINYVIPKFTEDKGFTIEKKNVFNKILQEITTEYYISSNNLIGLSVLIYKGKVFSYMALHSLKTEEEKIRFQTNLRKSNKFKRIGPGTYHALEMNEITFIAYLKGKTQEKGIIYIHAFNGNTNPVQIEKIKEMLLEISYADGIKTEIID
jgi:hypothetical protein